MLSDRCCSSGDCQAESCFCADPYFEAKVNMGFFSPFRNSLQAQITAAHTNSNSHSIHSQVVHLKQAPSHFLSRRQRRMEFPG